MVRRLDPRLEGENSKLVHQRRDPFHVSFWTGNWFFEIAGERAATASCSHVVLMVLSWEPGGSNLS